MRVLRRGVPVWAAALAAGVLAGCGGADGHDGSHVIAASRRPPSPLEGRKLFVDPHSDAAQEVRRLAAAGRRADARRMQAIAERPVATWFTGDEPGLDSADPAAEAAALQAVTTEAQALTTRAAASGSVPLLVAYDIPHRDCGSFSTGGATTARAYRSWVAALAAGIGRRPALVVIEPDAVSAVADPASHCLDAVGTAERFALLRAAVRTIKALPRTLAYLDAGNPGWVPPARMVQPLRRAGALRADGLSVNVANFKTTRASLDYGDALGRRLGGRHYVVDTSRNGNGPYGGLSGPEWCNPPGRALGRPPSARTGRRLADAFLWIKPPGDSDGACRPGEPPAGVWWPEYALGLAQRARSR